MPGHRRADQPAPRARVTVVSPAGRLPVPVTDAVELSMAEPLTADEAGYVEAPRSANTMRGYRSDWRDFTAWCGIHDRPSMPAAAAPVTGSRPSLAASTCSPSWARRRTARPGRRIGGGGAHRPVGSRPDAGRELVRSPRGQDDRQAGPRPAAPSGHAVTDGQRPGTVCGQRITSVERCSTAPVRLSTSVEAVDVGQPAAHSGRDPGKAVHLARAR